MLTGFLISLMRSILHGIIGALIAIGMLVALIYFAQKELKGAVSFQDIDIIGILFLIVIILGIVITWVSTFFAVNKYLRLKTNELYY